MQGEATRPTSRFPIYGFLCIAPNSQVLSDMEKILLKSKCDVQALINKVEEREKMKKQKELNSALSCAHPVLSVQNLDMKMERWRIPNALVPLDCTREKSPKHAAAEGLSPSPE